MGLLVLLPHAILSMMERIIAEDEELREHYSTERSNYLEEQTQELFELAFGRDSVLAGNQWTDASGTQWENDVLVVVAPFAFVVECKSGKVSPPARRAAPERLAKTLKELIVEPSEQAARLIALLRSSPSVQLTTANGKSRTIDASRIKYYLPVAVSFEQFGQLATNPARLCESGLFAGRPSQLALSINLNDLPWR